MAAFDLPINDQYLSISHKNDLDMSSLPQPSPLPEAQPFDPEVLPDFLNNVPPVVIRFLVEFGPVLAWARWIFQVLSWKSGDVTESWLALAVFWIACLALRITLKYLLPIFILTPYIVPQILSFVREPKARTEPPPSSEESLSRVLSDLTVVTHLLPQLPPFGSGLDLLWPGVLRLAGTIYIAYLLVLYLVPTKIVIGIVGTLLITWRAPWFVITRHLVLSNGWVQYTSRKVWLAMTGTAASEPVSASYEYLSPEPAIVKEVPEDVPPPSTLRFRFTVHENQRWWMGLDWTAALLPQERASWSSSPPALRPLPPPMTITVPTTKSVYLPLPGKNRDHLRMKRTAKWEWEDADWGVVIRLSPTSAPERVHMALPDTTGSSAEAEPISLPSSLLQRGLQRVGTIDLSSPTRSAIFSDPSTTSRTSVDGESDLSADATIVEGPGNVVARASAETDITDSEGWIYGDNKWEGSSGKGGIGKYTRHRRWTRVAILTETVEVVPASEDPSYRTKPASPQLEGSPSSPPGSPPVRVRVPGQRPTAAVITSRDAASGKPTLSNPAVSDSTEPVAGTVLGTKTDVGSSSKDDTASSLRKRLQLAVAGS